MEGAHYCNLRIVGSATLGLWAQAITDPTKKKQIEVKLRSDVPFYWSLGIAGCAVVQGFIRGCLDSL